jgi:hypothetical protein
MKKLMIALFAATLIFSFTMPAMAAVHGQDGMDIAIDGRVEWNVEWTSSSAAYNGRLYDDDDMNKFEETGSRVRFHFKKDALSADFDMRDGKFDNYGVGYDFGSFRIKYGVITPLLFNPALDGPPAIVPGFHTPSAPSVETFIVTIPMGPVTLSLGATTPFTQGTNIIASYETDTNMPGFEAKLDFVVGPVAGAVYGGMISYEEVDSLNRSYDIDADTVGIVLRTGFGPLRLNAGLSTGTNNYFGCANGPGPALISAANTGKVGIQRNGTQVEDYEWDQWAIGANYMFNDMVSIGVGYGEVHAEMDNASFSLAENDASIWYIDIPIKINQFMTFKPYYNDLDGEDSKNQNGVPTDGGSQQKYGAVLSINF